MAKSETKKIVLDNVEIHVSIKTPFIPLSHYENGFTDTLLMVFPNDEFYFEKIGFPEVGDIGHIIRNRHGSNDENTELSKTVKLMEFCENTLNDNILTLVKWQYEKHKLALSGEKIEDDKNLKSGGDDKEKIKVKAYLVATTPRRYEIAMQYLYEATSNGVYPVKQADFYKSELFEIHGLFNRLYYADCPVNLIPLTIKLIQRFNSNRLPLIHLVTLSPKRMAKLIGVSLKKTQEATQWFIKHKFLRQRMPSENLYLRAAFFSSFYQKRPSDYGFRQYSQSPYQRKQATSIRIKIRYLAEQYTVKTHDANESKMQSTRSQAYRIHLRQLSQLQDNLSSDDYEIGHKKHLMRIMGLNLFKNQSGH
ncbi:MAG: hypothetical protein ACK5NC_04010 [Vibrio sp.]